MTLSNNIYDYKYFFTPLGRKDYSLPMPIRVISKVLEDQGFIKVRQVKLANTFSINLYDHHFSSFAGVKNFDSFEIFRQIKIESRSEYISHDKLANLRTMLESKDYDIVYMCLSILSKLNLIYADRVWRIGKPLNPGHQQKIANLVFQRNDPYIIMYWLFMTNDHQRMY